MTGNIYIEYKGVQFGVMHFPNKKKPCLYIQHGYIIHPVASFSSEEEADYFIKEIEKVLKKDE